MRRWRPDQELELLLQAFEVDILSAGEEELSHALKDAGLAAADSSLGVSGVIRAALEESEHPNADLLQTRRKAFGDDGARWPH